MIGTAFEALVLCALESPILASSHKHDTNPLNLTLHPITLLALHSPISLVDECPFSRSA